MATANKTDGSAPALSIIIVTHGARDLTMACLKSLAPEAAKINSEVIIVDNASRYDVAGEIASRYPDFQILYHATNLGFASAANRGADVARGKFLLFLNPDTIVTDRAIMNLLDSATGSSAAGIWGLRTVFPDGRLNPTCCRRRPTLWRLFCAGIGLDTRFPGSTLFSGMAYPDISSNHKFVVDVICGVCMLVPRNIWDRLGGFSPNFFMYGEDDDFCLRAARIGSNCTLLPEPAIVHYGSGTEPDQARKLCQILAARALVIRSSFPPPVRHAGLMLLRLRPFLGKIFARRELRPLWRSVWEMRQQWKVGQFV